MCSQPAKMEVVMLLSMLVSLTFFIGAGAEHQGNENVTVSLCLTPDKAQFFEYEGFSFHCVGGHSEDAWTVESSSKAPLGRQTSQTSDGALEVKLAYEYHTGDYWCQNARGIRSTATHIIVTTGQVLLDVPALPVVGQDLQLACRVRNEKKKASSSYFFKNNQPLKDPILRSPSSFDDGLYHCTLAGGTVGKSPHSQLTFRSLSHVCPTDEPTAVTVLPPVEASDPDSPSPQYLVLVLVASVGMFLLLAAAVAAEAAQRWCKHKGSLHADVECLSFITYRAVTMVKKRTKSKQQAPGEGESDPKLPTYTSVLCSIEYDDDKGTYTLEEP